MPTGGALDVLAILTPRAETGDSTAATQIFITLDRCRRELLVRERFAMEHQLAGSGDCAGVSRDATEARGRWLSRAAEAGLIEAQLMYAANPEAFIGDDALKNPERTIEYKRNAMRHLEMAARRGSAEALDSLSSAYQYGVLTKEDPVKAYAYMLASNRAYWSDGGEFQANAYAEHLTPQQRSQGERLSESIYATCCK